MPSEIVEELLRAEKLYISEHTVNFNVQNIFKKFNQNDGQVDEKVRLYEQGRGHTTFFTREGVTLQLYRSQSTVEEPSSKRDGNILDRKTAGKQGVAKEAGDPLRVERIRLIPLGANQNPEIVAEGLKEGKVSYFIGNDPKKWRSNIPTYEAVVYKELYPGIDMRFRCRLF